jgi:hypothetical protein
MVSSGLSNGMIANRPRDSVLQLLLSSGLMADMCVTLSDRNRGELILRHDLTGQRPSLYRLTITSKGFQFLLEDRQTQLWQILMYYLASREVSWSSRMVSKADRKARNESSAEVLSLFFSLGCMQLGQVRWQCFIWAEYSWQSGLLRIPIIPSCLVNTGRIRALWIHLQAGHTAGRYEIGSILPYSPRYLPHLWCSYHTRIGRW